MKGFLSFLLAVCFLLSFGNVSPASIPTQRIVNGGDATEASEYSVEVTSIFMDQLVAWGGGTLISSKIVVTSGLMVVGYQEFIVRFGALLWANTLYVQVEETIVHPNYNLRNQLHDIALMRLTDSVDTREYFRSVVHC